MQLTPLLGVVAGMVLSLVLVALAVLVALKLRARQPLDKLDKVAPKPKIGSLESVEKNPDIIPLNNGKEQYFCKFTSEQMFVYSLFYSVFIPYLIFFGARRFFVPLHFKGSQEEQTYRKTTTPSLRNDLCPILLCLSNKLVP